MKKYEIDVQNYQDAYKRLEENAQQADIWRFLLEKRPSDFTREADGLLRMKASGSVTVSQDAGAVDTTALYGDGRMDPVELLTKVLKYNTVSAVLALQPYSRLNESGLSRVAIGPYVFGGDYDKDCALLQSYVGREIGLKPIDDIQPFYPGLYIFAAATSIGKTTLMGQIADFQAGQGRTVLYYAREQTAVELISKGVARETVRICCEQGYEPYTPCAPFKCYSALDIRGRCADNTDVIAAKLSYADRIQDRIVIISDVRGYTARQIADDVRAYIAEHKPDEPPIIIVDYLQILTREDPRMSDKSAMDDAVMVLKNMQVETGATVLAVSSVSRSNYLTPLDLASLKESGGLEYGADVVVTLDLAIVSSYLFLEKWKAQGNSDKKKIAYRRARNKRLRKIGVCYQKNRNARAGVEFTLYYLPEFDIFTWENGMPWWDRGMEINGYSEDDEAAYESESE